MVDEPADICIDAPYVDYEIFGAGFMTGQCQGCHASTTPDRQEAPEEFFFDGVDKVQQYAMAILAATTGDDPIMPPAGGVDEYDRYLLEVWLTCWDGR